MSTEQAAVVAKHLNMVFAHEIDPSAGGSVEQKKLNDIHQGQGLQSSSPFDQHNTLIRC